MMDEWISVKDMLPEKAGYKLCWYIKGRQFVAWFSVNAGQWETKRLVTHWMPLPDPPQS